MEVKERARGARTSRTSIEHFSCSAAELRAQAKEDSGPEGSRTPDLPHHKGDVWSGDHTPIAWLPRAVASTTGRACSPGPSLSGSSLPAPASNCQKFLSSAGM